MKGIEVTIPGAVETPAFAVIPEGAKRGVVIIHEIFGRRPEIDRVALRFGRAGYAAVAPDLMARGTVACLVDFFRAMKSGQGPCVEQGRSARAWLCERAGLRPEQVGLIGFCFGGGYALLAGSGWAAVSTNYGPVPSARAMRGIGPVIGCYGSRDKSMASSPERLRARLAELEHDPPEIHTFDAGHSFLTDGALPFPFSLTRPLNAHGDYPEAREEGFRRIFAFFDKHLG